MARTRDRAKGRQGSEGERFSYLPESVLQHPALATAPHAALRVLAILVCGKSKERNGTMMCSESYALRFGIESRDTVRQSLLRLQERGLIERTRRVQPFRKAATLWAVTWWPIYFREGEPLPLPEPASHRYRDWRASTPVSGVNVEIPSHRSADSLTPVVGVEDHRHHTGGRHLDPIHHTGGRGHSYISGGDAQLERAKLADAITVARSVPSISPEDLASRARCRIEVAHLALQQIQADASP